MRAYKRRGVYYVIWIGGVIAVTASVAIWAWKVSPLLIIIPITVGGAALYILSALVGAVEHGAAESIYSDDELERYIEERMK